jgi:transposase
VTAAERRAAQHDEVKATKTIAAHQELKKAGVTLTLLWQEYRGAHPDRYAYSQFCARYRE